PQFAHVSAILGSDGKKLSKRHGATNVLAYQKEGILPEALLNALVRLGWSHGDQEIFSVEEMIHLFRIDDVHKSPAIFDPQKLIWFNQHYLKHLDNDKIIKYVMPFLDEYKLDLNNANKPNKPKLEKVVELLKPRAKNLKELAGKVAEFYIDEIKYDPAATDKFFTANSLNVLNKVLLKIQDLKDSEWTAEALHKHLNDLVAETGLKFPDVAQPIRVALLGHTNSPSINETMAVLSKNIVITRLHNAIKFIKSK
ncbi:MAG: glutamate--tRNA ligase, partial [Gammaproteobacteria bacterium]|nr:glutamate--tRNA ligase [Gammaproteobacteria bacterium]